jgi:hypothetical protein
MKGRPVDAFARPPNMEDTQNGSFLVSDPVAHHDEFRMADLALHSN